jgi:hypothetical protein
MALFEGLVVTEDGTPVELVGVGDAQFYVIDDHGFRRHVDARDVDRAVLGQFTAELEGHRDEAAAAMLTLMGQDDLFTKAAVDSALRNIDVERVLDETMPAEARQWLAMMGFLVVVDVHGDVVRVEMPAAPDGLHED